MHQLCLPNINDATDDLLCLRQNEGWRVIGWKRYFSVDERLFTCESSCALVALLLWVIVMLCMLVEGQLCILKPVLISSDTEWQGFELLITFTDSLAPRWRVSNPTLIVSLSRVLGSSSYFITLKTSSVKWWNVMLSTVFLRVCTMPVNPLLHIVNGNFILLLYSFAVIYFHRSWQWLYRQFLLWYCLKVWKLNILCKKNKK